jgi:hypothetical protein
MRQDGAHTASARDVPCARGCLLSRRGHCSRVVAHWHVATKGAKGTSSVQLLMDWARRASHGAAVTLLLHVLPLLPLLPLPPLLCGAAVQAPLPSAWQQPWRRLQLVAWQGLAGGRGALNPLRLT